MHRGDTIHTFSSQLEIKEAISTMVSERYQLCNETPFLEGRLHQGLGPIGNTPLATEALKGHYLPYPGTNPFVSILVQRLIHRGNLPQVCNTISTVAGTKPKRRCPHLSLGATLATTKQLKTLPSSPVSITQLAYCNSHFLPDGSEPHSHA